MIIRETDQEFIMIAQHDHAIFSGDVATHFKEQYFYGDTHEEDALIAVYEHDRSWIGLDDTPIWDDKRSRPFSFEYYPLLPKLAFYKIGLDEIEEQNEYAGLICSIHYSSFSALQNTSQKESQQFCLSEIQRQQRLRQKLNLTKEDTIEKHFRFLRLCDDISLYVCLNQPGSSKEREHPWFRNGFAHSERFNGEDSTQPLVANWVNDKGIRIHPCPFESDFSAELRFKRVSKKIVKNIGIADAYKNAGWEEQECIFETE